MSRESNGGWPGLRGLMGMVLVKEYYLGYVRWISFRDLLYSSVYSSQHCFVYLEVC